MTAKELKEALKAMCPNCDGSGIIPNGITKMSYGQDDNGNFIELGTYIEYEQEQCEWCYVFDSKLQAFCKQLCQEQSIRCARVYEFESLDTDLGLYEHIRESIENAPMPEL